ncbi:sulfatase-like hydrolase/transferase [Stieleria sp. TO1_6]|uniref:sulfatase-like hydrolase/transferase n=1 Tax=Stieleria tagensis TaxID=2956795 RepID=UPI00209B9D5C|nr:sulfatase-like hydrolase/transferase [Stieleria tagensis]MCO8123597.1 sulfatase-like hydrolase/transferase [Stieleria tagensis]
MLRLIPPRHSKWASDLTVAGSDNRFRSLICLCWLLVIAAAGRADCFADPPNVLLILADDLGFSDLGCYGGEIQTPQLDSLAETGLRFTQFYNTGRCWPTRGSMLTGYYAQQIRRDHLPGIPSGGRGERPEWAELLPKMLSTAGYRSYHTGKWHIDGQPLDSGFDRTSLNQTGRYFEVKETAGGKREKPLQFREDFYLTSAMADDAIDNLKDHAANHADKPFFQYLAFTAPHFPLHALPQDIAIYSDTYTVGWDVIRAQRWQRMQSMGLLDPATIGQVSAVERELGPPYHFPDAFEILGDGELNRPLPWKNLTPAQQEFQATKMAIHAAMIHRMDLEIGRVFDQIRQMGRWDDTLVMFLSDNGASAEIMVRGDGHDPSAAPGSGATYLCLGPGWSTACNTPFRRHKTWTHEGGISTPMLVSWPARVRSGGDYRRNPHHVIDIVPTILQLAGASHRQDAPPPPGESFVAELEHQVDAPPRSLWWYHDGHKAMRRGDWKAVAPEGEPWELYDLATDRGESTDLALPHANVLEELVAAWQNQLDQSIAMASEGISPTVLEKEQGRTHNAGKMWDAQQAARIKRVQVLPQGESFRVADRHAFLMAAENPATTKHGKPWVFYAPTLRRYPDKNETWMHQRFLDAGVSVAGIDIGEGYGSPYSQPLFDALYDEMVSRGYSSRPVLLGRSRGGLAVARFAIEHPERVAAIGGIYPVFDYTSYPGVERAAAVYGVSAKELLEKQLELNPIKRVDRIAQAKIPVFLIHGTEDTLVPLKQNSGAFETTYHANGAQSNITLKRIEGQGHSAWPGFFQDDDLVNFLIDTAKSE